MRPQAFADLGGAVLAPLAGVLGRDRFVVPGRGAVAA
jgi:hypothetical protein